MDGAQEVRNMKSRAMTEILEYNDSSLQYGSIPCGHNELPDSLKINFFMD
jgi:hypothetical protein